MEEDFRIAWQQISKRAYDILKRQELVDEAYNLALYQAMSIDSKQTFLDRVTYFKVIIHNVVRKEYRDIRKHRATSYLEDIAHDSDNDFRWENTVDIPIEVESEETGELFDKLDIALSELTNKQREAILAPHHPKYGKGVKSNTILNTRKHALGTLRRKLGAKIKGRGATLTPKQQFYLDIYRRHKRGEIADIKIYLRENGLTYSTYYSMVKYAKNKIPSESV